MVESDRRRAGAHAGGLLTRLTFSEETRATLQWLAEANEHLDAHNAELLNLSADIGERPDDVGTYGRS